MSGKGNKNMILSMSDKFGFDLIGFASPEVDESIEKKFDEWIDKRYYAGMEWMKKTSKIRKDPNKLLPGVKTIISVAMSYLPRGNPYFASYSLGKDYHYIFKKKMKKFAVEFLKRFPDEKIMFANDTKPLFERYFAWKAGLGFIGRNTLLITKEYGSYVILGAFLTTLKVEYDKEGEGTCGTCMRCVESCPTGALKPYSLDANKCIAYWSIEHKGDFPKYVDLAGKLFGCDKCQEVCPYNKRALKRRHNELYERRIPDDITPDKILNMDEEEFRKLFKGTPVMRAGYEGLKRNASRILER